MPDETPIGPAALLLEIMNVLKDHDYDDPRDVWGGEVHLDMDCILTRELKALGYGEAIAVYNTVRKWYA